MHAKSDSEVTSVEQSTPPRSPRRPIYYVQSPSNHDVEKMSYGSSPAGSPAHHFYHCSPIHHSRESSTSRFSASLKNPRSPLRLAEAAARRGGRRIRRRRRRKWHRFRERRPRPQRQAGSDRTGVPTDMLSLNSTVRIHYRNPATFFGVHVTSTPLELHYFQLKVASGQIENFYQARKTHRTIRTVVLGSQVALYGGVSVVQDVSENRQRQRVAVPLNLTFVVRSRAYILGKLVKSKFYERIRCSVTLRGSNLGKHSNLTNSCVYE
ncbi:hypothetical protein GBA52_027810 [Prunus armeniaca]|nr:hypothetical protein GBA52_027810 [Prunus armeniaca]